MVNLVEDGELKVLLAPTGSGKTHFILNCLDKGLQKIIFVSPLRALAMEFYEKAQRKSLLVCPAMKQEEFEGDWEFLVTTPESMKKAMLEKLSLCHPKPLIILDEIHLFYKWGNTFRPRLLSFIEQIGSLGFPSLGLTATLDHSSLDWLKHSVSQGFETTVLDHGNMKMNFPPLYNVHFPRQLRVLFNTFFEDQMRKESHQTALYFCRTRDEVFNWVDYFHWLGIRSMGCVGGDTTTFMKNYDRNKPPRVIFSTSALSHGVNLGVIDEIYINHPLEDEDMWIQMASRGGRTGENFTIYSFNSWGPGNKPLWCSPILLKLLWSRLSGIFRV
jgi:superfamily II DNA helicase RecQ